MQNTLRLIVLRLLKNVSCWKQSCFYMLDTDVITPHKIKLKTDLCRNCRMEMGAIHRLRYANEIILIQSYGNPCLFDWFRNLFDSCVIFRRQFSVIKDVKMCSYSYHGG